MQRFESPEQSVLAGYPRWALEIVGAPVRSPDDRYAVVVFRLTSGEDRYEVSVCDKPDGGWREGTSGSASPAPSWAWSATGPNLDDGIGVLSWFGEAPGAACEATVEAIDHSWAAAVDGGSFVAAVWGIDHTAAYDLAADLVRPGRMRFG